jgi:hypothetical protein
MSMNRWIVFVLGVASLGLGYAAWTAENANYPPPRFPSYIKPPKSIEEVMPFARAAVRQTGGRTPLGLVEKGMTVAIFTEPTAEEMVLQAIKRAYEERGVKVQIVPEQQLLGVSQEEALKAVKISRWFTSEQGYMEVRAWLLQRFADPEVPKKWLKEHRPDSTKPSSKKKKRESLRSWSISDENSAAKASAKRS